MSKSHHEEKLDVENIKTILNGMMQKLHDEFNEQLVAFVVYGSYARGEATRRSDIDLLVVVKGLPRNWKKIHELEDEWMKRGSQLGKRFQVMLASPEDVEESAKSAAPLMLEIYDAHKILFDQDDFFRNCIIRMESLMIKQGIRMRKPGVWEVPEYETP